MRYTIEKVIAETGCGDMRTMYLIVDNDCHNKRECYISDTSDDTVSKHNATHWNADDCLIILDYLTAPEREFENSAANPVNW